MVEQGGNQELRETLENSADPRVSRTRAAILAAVRSIAATDGEISVSAIARAAGISRASFYSHYASLDDLANSVLREAFVEIGTLYDADRLESSDAMLVSQQRLVAHFADNRALYAAVAALPVTKESYLADVRAMSAVIEAELMEHPNRPARLQAAATARYIAGAATGLLDAWVTGELELTEPELVEHLMALLPTWFSGVR